MRKDIMRVSPPANLAAIFPYIMKRRCDSQVYYQVDLNAEPLLDLIDQTQALTFFQALLLALIKTMRDRPLLNRFVMGRRLYERRNIDISFIVRRPTDGDGSESHVKLRFASNEDDPSIIEKIALRMAEAQVGVDITGGAAFGSLMALPGFLRRAAVSFLSWRDFHMGFPKGLEEADPLHCSAYVAELGVEGVSAPFHHLAEWGTCSMFLAIGTVGPKLTIDESGFPVVRQMAEVKVTFDERIADSNYFARALEIFKNYVESPETLYDADAISEYAQRRLAAAVEQFEPFDPYAPRYPDAAAGQSESFGPDASGFGGGGQPDADQFRPFEADAPRFGGEQPDTPDPFSVEQAGR